ncbi:MAG: sulfatase-like hydrolase/transferase [Clostridiales bacterium]|nr:sulfatase-like hydrolase/transferase [Clostridiales bacterium]
MEKKTITLDKSLKVFPVAAFAVGALAFVLTFILRLNAMAVAALGYCAVISLAMLLGILFKKRLYLWMLSGYAAALSGVVLYFVVFGADAGFGGFTNGLAGFKSVEHALLTGSGSFLTRLAGNLLLVLPSVIIAAILLVIVKKADKKALLQKILSAFISLALIISTVAFLLTVNLRSKPNTQRLWQGHDDYLKAVDKTKTKDSPNVLFILMDDLGYGDISLNGAIYDTPNIDSIGENGVELTNFYASYSVCSPSRFAALTGRYPYRGYADNVIYPTVNSTSQFCATRLYNSFEMGNNADGMLGDEITIAETLSRAGYTTGCFGKWHLGDYGEYLPTNQGFDYFYGSHHVNDMTPFYHVREQGGEYEIVHGYDELKDQSKATEWIYSELESWIINASQGEKPFFAYYTSPWPHAPVYAGDAFDGTSGMGTYVDCITEFDHYLGKLFDTLERLGELDDTIIIFTSDNGPALEGSTDNLRGGKYLAYEGGQKVPFLMRWDNGDVIEKGSSLEQSATLVDLYPTLIDLCGITGNGGTQAFLPSDRIIDGVSMLPLLENGTVIHTPEHPILYMKREKLKSIQYTVPTSEILARSEYSGYNFDVLKNNDTVTFKYFQRIQNDNSAFFDKFRKNWLHILNDDEGENYNRTPVYPTVAAEMSEKMDEIMSDFSTNRRGVIK